MPPSSLKLSRLSHGSRSSFEKHLEPRDDPTRIAPPSHRHAAPSAPWPWVDIQDEVDEVQLASSLPPVPELCDHKSCEGCWVGYPQSRFPNWTPRQVKKSKIYKAIHDYRRDLTCKCYHVDVDVNGRFTDPGAFEAPEGKEADTWDRIINTIRPNNLRVRALFLENMSGPILQMLGAKYNIEPFFFSSSLGWIPSRFQEEIRPKIGDHITVTLPFIKSMSNYDAMRLSATSPYNASTESIGSVKKPGTLLGSQKIDTQAPLSLYSNNRLLVLDLLSVHLIRSNEGSTIISYHPSLNIPTTTAHYLHERIQFAGQSVYWQSIFQQSPDPTFVLLTFLWHAMYAWDEALEHLYEHICSLETRVITTNEMPLTQELHVIRAHHLHYVSLLHDFSKSVLFVRDTESPAMEVHPQEVQDFSRALMKRECANLLSEIDRLDLELKMQDRRLKNVMNLVFSSVNITDSRYMREMTEAAVRDSAAMKQIAYLTMIFLPASFVAAVFGMNVGEIAPGTLGTIAHYVEIAVPLTIITIWVIVAFQSRYIFPDDVSFWQRLGWPVLLIKRRFGKQSEDDESTTSSRTAVLHHIHAD
ncbi:hypothetical protein BDQ12DRAFT_694125 [Crucibulum laeve]|uniref:Uncharacterized protein n=1 Tax=Crucibulum laeve TaxID=68775 RepID=A0A5C3LEB7_9AGAR|nr:hypothetical protein BDQ12DRAFT_694125 [Crucibulum laeve]